MGKKCLAYLLHMKMTELFFGMFTYLPNIIVETALAKPPQFVLRIVAFISQIELKLYPGLRLGDGMKHYETLKH